MPYNLAIADTSGKIRTRGKKTYDNGRYEGEFLNGVMDGQGEFFFANGNHY